MLGDTWEKLIVGLVVALVAAPLGGWIAWHFKGRELARVELRARLAAIEADIRALRDKAMLYWSRDGNDEKSIEAARDIKAKDRQLGQELRSVYGMMGLSVTAAERYRMSLRKEMTGGDFEGANRLKSDSRCDAISDTAGFLIAQVRQDFRIV